MGLPFNWRILQKLLRPHLLLTMTQSVFLAVFTGVLCTLIGVAWLVSDERLGWLQHNQYQFVAARLEQFVDAYTDSPDEQRDGLIEAAYKFGIVVRPANSLDLLRVVPNSPLSDALDNLLASDHSVASLWIDNCMSMLPAKRAQEIADEWRLNSFLNPFRLAQPRVFPVPVCEGLLVAIDDDVMLNISALIERRPDGVFSYLPYELPENVVLWGVVLILFLLLLSYSIARMTMASVRQLSQAAQDLGHNLQRSPIPVKGGKEIRQAINAFNTMQAQIQNQVKDRTEMLAAITHDLQTPLTRLRLRLEKVKENSLQTQLINDLAGTQKIVEEGLAWARSRSVMSTQKINLSEMLLAITHDSQELGLDVCLIQKTTMSPIFVMGNATALQRALQNIVDNALKYGELARIECHLSKSDVEVTIDDAGHGVPESSLEDVFKPYYRLEQSRSRETGGSGLGLSIARNFIEAMGGTLVLNNRIEGGLRATIRLQRT